MSAHQAAAADVAATGWPNLRLTAILAGDAGLSYARINDCLVTVGSVVSGAVVVAIASQSVTMEWAHERRDITLATKRTPAAPGLPPR